MTLTLQYGKRNCMKNKCIDMRNSVASQFYILLRATWACHGKSDTFLACFFCQKCSLKTIGRIGWVGSTLRWIECLLFRGSTEQQPWSVTHSFRKFLTCSWKIDMFLVCFWSHFCALNVSLKSLDCTLPRIFALSRIDLWLANWVVRWYWSEENLHLHLHF